MREQGDDSKHGKLIDMVQEQGGTPNMVSCLAWCKFKGMFDFKSWTGYAQPVIFSVLCVYTVMDHSYVTDLPPSSS